MLVDRCEIHDIEGFRMVVDRSEVVPPFVFVPHVLHREISALRGNDQQPLVHGGRQPLVA